MNMVAELHLPVLKRACFPGYGGFIMFRLKVSVHTSLRISILIISALSFFFSVSYGYAAQGTLTWDANQETNLAGYKVYYGAESRVYDHSIDVGNQTTYALTNLTDGQTYYFAATAYDSAGNESDYSVELSWTSPPANQPPTASNGSLTATEDSAASGTLSAADADGDQLTYTIITNGAKGTVSLTDSSTGAYIYQPEANATGADTFTFSVDDGTTDSNIATVTVNITAVNDAPTAYIKATNIAGEAPLSVSFDGSDSTDVDGTIETYSWTFDDGGSGNGPMTEHTFTVSGTYEVALLVADNEGLTAKGITTITVTAPANIIPTATISTSTTENGAPLVSFDGSGSDDPDGTIVAYNWNFGDGETGIGEFIEHTFAAPGVYTVTMTVTDDEDAIAQAVAEITVVPQANEPPTAIITAGALEQGSPLLSFSGSDSNDPDGYLVEFTWDFGDGYTGNGISAEHEYLLNGEYTVTLTVKDDEGDTALAQVSILVTNVLPEPFETAVNFQPQDAPAAENFTIDYGRDFDEISGYGWINNNRVFKVWDRDSDLSPDQSYDTLIYVSPKSVWELAVPNGRYTVTVCMGDPERPIGIQNAQVEGLPVIEEDSLNSDTPWLEREITVDVVDERLTLTFAGRRRFVRLNWIKVKQLNEFPTAVITTSGVGNGASYLLGFDGSDSYSLDGGAIISYSWNFGDGETAMGAYVEHEFQWTGTYAITLTVTDEAGTTAQAQKSINVGANGN